MTNVPSDGRSVKAMLDLEYSSQDENVVQLDGVGEWLKEAHDRILHGWLGCISPKLHDSLGPEAICAHLSETIPV